jgi:hypothetical protein
MNTSIECKLCSGGDILFDQKHPLTGMSCRELEFQVSLFHAEECSTASSFLQFDPNLLCCSNNNPENPTSAIPCPICIDQQTLGADQIVATEAYGEISCLDAQLAANLLTSEQICTDFRQQFSDSCCVDLPNDGVGSDASDLTTPSSGIPVQAPDTDNSNDPIIPECRICPLGQQLSYPSRVLFAYNEQQTCNDIEKELSSVMEATACLSLLDKSRALSNCACRERLDNDLNGNSNPVIEVNGSGTRYSLETLWLYSWLLILGML